MTWSDTFLAALKDNDVRLIRYVPDNVLTPLIKGVAADNYFMSVNATREDEALGTVAGAWMGGLRGIVMMQTSGFALIANAPAARFARGRAPHARRRAHPALRGRPLDQAGHTDPEPRRLHPLAAVDRRESGRPEISRSAKSNQNHGHIRQPANAQ